VGRGAILEGVEEEAELLAALFFADVQGGKHFFLYRLFVDTHRTATHFPAVQHHVVGLG